MKSIKKTSKKVKIIGICLTMLLVTIGYVNNSKPVEAASSAITIQKPIAIGINNSPYKLPVTIDKKLNIISISVSSGYLRLTDVGYFKYGVKSSTDSDISPTSNGKYLSVQLDSRTLNVAEIKRKLESIEYVLPDSGKQKVTIMGSETALKNDSDLYFKGHFYSLSKDKMTWLNAMNWAFSQSAYSTDGYISYPVTVTSFDENQLLVNLYKQGKNIWLGAVPKSIQAGSGSIVVTGKKVSLTGNPKAEGVVGEQGDSYVWMNGTPEANQPLASNTSNEKYWYCSAQPSAPNDGGPLYLGYTGAYWDDLKSNQWNDSNTNTLMNTLVEYSKTTPDPIAETIVTINTIENPNEFVINNLTKNNQVITESTKENYQQILNAESAYAALSPTAKNEVNKILASKKLGLTYEELLEHAKAIEQLQNKKSAAINKMTINADKQKDLISNLPYLTDAQKNDKINDINSKLKAATASINSDSCATDAEINKVTNDFITDVNSIVNDAKKLLVEAITAKSNEKKAEIEKLNHLTNDDKEMYKKQIDASKNEAILAVNDTAATNSSIKNAVDKFDSDLKTIGMNAMTLDETKKQAKIDLDAQAKAKKSEISSMKDLTLDEINAFHSKIDELLTAGNQAIEAAKNVTEVQNAVTVFGEKTTKIVNEAQLENDKNNAKNDLLKYANEKKSIIEKLDLSDKQKSNLIKEVDDELVKGNKTIDTAKNQNGVTKALTDAKAEIDKVVDKSIAEQFANKYLRSENGSTLYNEVNSQNVDQIVSGRNDWNKLSAQQQAIVNSMITSDTNKFKTYQDYLDGANKLANDSTEQFMKDHMTKENGDTVIAVDETTLDNILGGENDFDKLSQYEKDAINKKLGDEGATLTYSQMLEEAKKLAQKNAEEFITNHLTDKDGHAITSATKDSLDQILAAEDNYNALSQSEKEEINKQLSDKAGKPITYDDMLNEAKNMLNETTDEFIQDHMTKTNGDVIIDVTKDTLDNILGGEEDFNALTPAQQAEVNRKLADAGAKLTYQEMLAQAKEMLDSTTDGFIQDHMTKTNGDVIIDVTKETLDSILGGEEDFNALTPAQQAEVNRKLADAGAKLTYQEMLDQAKEILNDTTQQFIKDHMITNDGKVVIEVTKDTLDNILGGEEDFNALTPAQQSEVNRKLANAGAKLTYQEMLAQAKEMLDSTTDGFIQDHMTKTNGDVIIDVTKETLDSILGGEKDFNALTPAQQVEVNRKLADAGAKLTYQEMLAQAKKELASTTDGFIKVHMTQNGKTIIDVTKDTLGNILGGEKDFNALTSAQQAEVNAKLKAAGATQTYQEMLVQAKAMLDTTTDKFIKDHMTKKNGNIVIQVTKDVYEMILGGEEDFNALTPVQQAEVNAKLKAAGATQTYQEMLAQVKKELTMTGIEFIQKYVSDIKGNIYLKATKDNYQQILSGLTTWSQYTQVEKDVINAALIMAGGQTYEDLIAQAGKIKASLTVTSDTTNLYGYMAGFSICGLALLYDLKRRRQAQQ